MVIRSIRHKGLWQLIVRFEGNDAFDLDLLDYHRGALMSDMQLGPMKNPPHPGELVREDVVKALGLTVTRAAELLGISRSNLSLFLNERVDLSPEMALRLEAAFGLEAGMLLGMQTDHDLARARLRQAEITAKVRRFRPAPA